jgi:16S rRNA processing protein RimM
VAPMPSEGGSPGADATDRSPRRLITVGRIGAPHGVLGWVRIISETDPPENIFRYRPWQVGGRPTRVLERRRSGKALVARLDGCTDREDASRYTNREIAVYRDQLPPPRTDEFYWVDLEGLMVETTSGETLGRVDHLLETGANDVLVVRGDRERLVPFVWDDVIKEVDFQRGVVRVDWDPDF